MNLMGPKLLADIHISPVTVTDLRAKGYEIHRVSDLISASASDAKIIELAILENVQLLPRI
jgi:predicted nuclease of predicted toxin-antitoxin system